MRQKLLTFTVFLLSSIFLTLCTNPTEPKDNLLPEKEYEPGTRDYVWSIDTIKNSNYYTDLWGNSPGKVWIVGSGPENEQHYMQYLNDSLVSTNHIDLTNSPWTVFGFKENDVWFGCTNFTIKHYDGSSISVYSSINTESYRNRYITDIWGKSKDDIYAVGSLLHNDGNLHAIILHFDGNTWDYEIEPVEKLHFGRIRQDDYSNPYYIWAVDSDITPPDSVFFLSFQQGNLIRINIDNPQHHSRKFLNLLDGTLYFRQEEFIYKLWNNKFLKKISLINSDVNSSTFFGRNENDLFYNHVNGIAHYNGENTKVIYPFNEKIGLVDAVLFENDVYFLGYFDDVFKFFVLHGTIN